VLGRVERLRRLVTLVVVLEPGLDRGLDQLVDLAVVELDVVDASVMAAMISSASSGAASRHSAVVQRLEERARPGARWLRPPASPATAGGFGGCLGRGTGGCRPCGSASSAVVGLGQQTLGVGLDGDDFARLHADSDGPQAALAGFVDRGRDVVRVRARVVELGTYGTPT
jgi:hypothetical protein